MARALPWKNDDRSDDRFPNVMRGLNGPYFLLPDVGTTRKSSTNCCSRASPTNTSICPPVPAPRVGNCPKPAWRRRPLSFPPSNAAWPSAMIGVSLTNSRRERFERAFEQGSLLMMVDVPNDQVEKFQRGSNRTSPRLKSRARKRQFRLFRASASAATADKVNRGRQQPAMKGHRKSRNRPPTSVSSDQRS